MRLTANPTARRGAAVLLAAGLVFGLGACGDDEDDDTAAGDTDTEATQPDGAGDAVGGDDDSADDTAEDAGAGSAGGEGLVITGFEFGPVSAAPGATVAVTNDSSAPHTVTSDDDAFDEVTVDGGASAELTAPSEAGEYAFHCEIHPSMTGTLVVE